MIRQGLAGLAPAPILGGGQPGFSPCSRHSDTGRTAALFYSARLPVVYLLNALFLYLYQHLCRPGSGHFHRGSANKRACLMRLR